MLSNQSLVLELSNIDMSTIPSNLRDEPATLILPPIPLPPLSSSHTPESLSYDNIQLLQQALTVLNSFSGEVYVGLVAPAFNSNIGTHFRHCLNFYQTLLGEFDSGRVDYDHRERDPRLATERGYAIQKYADMIERLCQLAHQPANQSVWVRQDTSFPAEDDKAWAQSTLLRELQSLVSHTIHHFALIALMLRLQGIEPPPTFGVAPSTVAYWQAA